MVNIVLKCSNLKSKNPLFQLIVDDNWKKDNLNSKLMRIGH